MNPRPYGHSNGWAPTGSPAQWYHALSDRWGRRIESDLVLQFSHGIAGIRTGTHVLMHIWMKLLWTSYIAIYLRCTSLSPRVHLLAHRAPVMHILAPAFRDLMFFQVYVSKALHCLQNFAPLPHDHAVRATRCTGLSNVALLPCAMPAKLSQTPAAQLPLNTLRGTRLLNSPVISQLPPFHHSPRRSRQRWCQLNAPLPWNVLVGSMSSGQV